jgi:Ca-activated chloride channel family protein
MLLSDGQANAGETKRSTLAREAEQARERGITTSTIGVGQDFQEDLLKAIATGSGGRFWYIQDSEIEDIISEEFQGSLSVIYDRPRVELRLPPGVTIARELNSLPKVGGRYRARPLKGNDTFNFAVRLAIDPEISSSDEIILGAALLEADKEIAVTEISIPLHDSGPFFVAQPRTLVQSVVRQHESTIKDGRVLEQLDAGDLDSMRRMLVDEIAEMREVTDQLGREPEDQRSTAELRRILVDLETKEVSIVVADVLTGFIWAPETKAFMRRWRKILMVCQHRNDIRDLEESPKDEGLERELTENAVALLDILIARYPDHTEELQAPRETLSARLARR